jgi:hypothetical protein
MLGVWDIGSPAHTQGHYDAAWDEAWKFDRDPPGAASWKHSEMELACERFEQYWSHLQSRGEVLAWKPGTGVYKVELRLLPQAPRKRAAAILRCPSGGLAVAGLKCLGSPDLEPVLRVPPGVYRVGVGAEKPQLAGPRPFRTRLEYPERFVPDYIVTLQEK